MVTRMCFVLLTMAGCASAPSEKMTFKMVDENGRCLVDVDGRLLEPVAAAEAIKGKVTPSNQIEIVSSREAPYRCVGTAVFYLQRAGFSEVSFRPE